MTFSADALTKAGAAYHKDLYIYTLSPTTGLTKTANLPLIVQKENQPSYANLLSVLKGHRYILMLNDFNKIKGLNSGSILQSGGMLDSSYGTIHHTDYLLVDEDGNVTNVPIWEFINHGKVTHSEMMVGLTELVKVLRLALVQEVMLIGDIPDLDSVSRPTLLDLEEIHWASRGEIYTYLLNKESGISFFGHLPLIRTDGGKAEGKDLERVLLGRAFIRERITDYDEYPDSCGSLLNMGGLVQQAYETSSLFPNHQPHEGIRLASGANLYFSPDWVYVTATGIRLNLPIWFGENAEAAEFESADFEDLKILLQMLLDSLTAPILFLSSHRDLDKILD